MASILHVDICGENHVSVEFCLNNIKLGIHPTLLDCEKGVQCDCYNLLYSEYVYLDARGFSSVLEFSTYIL